MRTSRALVVEQGLHTTSISYTSVHRAHKVPATCHVGFAMMRPRMAVSAESYGPSTSGTMASLVCNHAARRNMRNVVAAASPAGQLQRPGSMGKVGVVIVDHGSRKKVSNEMLVEFGQLYGKLTGEEIVEIAHMEIASPTIEEAVGRCAARGASTVVVAPYFLSRGRHIQQDIPALVAEAATRHPGLTCVIAEPIGIDPLMVQLISNRVASAIQGLMKAEDEDGKQAGGAVAPATTDA
ncbi:hypothetical protein Agub_g2378 [Astrephomene gubernaculifera]|uniref:Sirohydrochlorin cobaltochelatase n=1 Tax=Astrephomene gubernaculifera TaxID=47775 RepID=A0AAD3HI85_9CHLO|nr:hypothetical protein Agub_g2378 [Astrephomene gubernaculifera]